MTDLPNRTLFMERLGHALDGTAERRKGKVAVLFVDLDNFKVLNDSLGPAAGDRLLTAAGGRLRACLRLKDTIARFGGDEFTILLEGVGDVSHAVRAANRILEELRAPFALEKKDVFISPSIGIALNAAAGERAEDLRRKVDTALYQAETQGKAYYYKIFDPSMYAGALKCLEMESDLRRALERGQLRGHYQPKVKLDVYLRHYLSSSRSRAIVAGHKVTETPRIWGIEALVRWEHPKLGLVCPDKLIPIAEETELIVPIGQWVLKEACRQARKWQERYPNESFLMSVNLSARQFQHPNLLRGVTRALSETGLPPSSLCLEITGSIVMEDAQSTITTLRELKNLDVRLAIDDFGTGYSSLSYLRRFPADHLKVDRSFINELGEDNGSVRLVAGLIRLAHTSGMKVIAEGVESPEQPSRLRGLSCDLAQGYYFSEPLPDGAVSAVLPENEGPQGHTSESIT